MPLYDAHRAFVLGAAVLHADETPVNMLDPGSGKTKRAYVWAYARSAFDALPGVVYGDAPAYCYDQVAGDLVCLDKFRRFGLTTPILNFISRCRVI